jgi:hypothetical protein
MGLLFRPRRPLMRLATGAATAGIAYHAGRRRAEQDAYDEEAEAAYQATQAPQAPSAYAPAAPAAPAVPFPDDPTVAELARLAQMHQAGSLTDQEFAAAKARVLGG